MKRILLVRPFAQAISETGHPRNVRVPFTLKYMEALLADRPGVAVKVLDGWLHPRQDLLKEMVAWRPDLFVIDSTTLDRQRTLAYASVLKQQGVFTVAIGQDPSGDPQHYLFDGSPIDAVLAGESEFSLLEFLEALEGERPLGPIAGLHTRQFQNREVALVEDLDRLPFPNYTDEEFRGYRFLYPVPLSRPVRWAHLLTSRGCPYACTFCCQTVRMSYGQRVRLRSPANIVDEIELLVRRGANVIAFEDDLLTISREQVRRLCQELLRRKVRVGWSAHARIDNVEEGLLRLMKEAGCVQLRFGIESGSNRIIEILKKNPKKLDWVAQAKAVFEGLRRIGLPGIALMIIGNPSENFAEMRATMRLTKELQPDLVQVHLFTPAPGSEAYVMYQDRIPRDILDRMYHFGDVTVNLSAVTDGQLQEAYRAFYRNFYLRPGFMISHLKRYGLFYLANPEVLVKLLGIWKKF